MPLSPPTSSAIAIPSNGRWIRRRREEQAAVEALARGLMAASKDGWDVEVSRPDNVSGRMWRKTFVRFRRVGDLA